MLQIGEGLQNYINEKGLHPVSSEWREVRDASDVRVCLTEEGFIYASQDSGEWRFAGPFAEAG